MVVDESTHHRVIGNGPHLWRVESKFASTGWRGQSNAIEQSVKIERDVLGQAVIHAQNRLDAAYALGFAHGQDRFFQMDLLRRNAAGELSELFGKAALELDKKMRFHQLRKRSQFLVEQLPAADKSTIGAYAKGVNEGYAQTGFDSFEYILTARVLNHGKVKTVCLLFLVCT